MLCIYIVYRVIKTFEDASYSSLGCNSVSPTVTPYNQQSGLCTRGTFFKHEYYKKFNVQSILYEIAENKQNDHHTATILDLGQS